MKTLKTLFSVLVLAAVFSVNAFAQSINNVDVSASATVLSTLTLNFQGAGNSDEIAFGNLVIDNYTAIVQSDGTTPHQLTGQSAAPANGKLTADEGTVVFISYSASAIMTNDDDDDLTITPSLHVGATSIPATGGTFTMPVGGEADVVVGASVNITDSTPAGTYTTDNGTPITITFNFN